MLAKENKHGSMKDKHSFDLSPENLLRVQLEDDIAFGCVDRFLIEVYTSLRTVFKDCHRQYVTGVKEGGIPHYNLCYHFLFL